MTDLDRVAGMLRRSEPYVADNGFTSAVLARLPSARTLPLWEQNLILLAATVIGSAIAAWQVPAAGFVSFVSATMRPLFDLAPALGQFQSTTTLIVAGAAAVYVLASVSMWAVRNELS
jgi:hypothetical protein